MIATEDEQTADVAVGPDDESPALTADKAYHLLQNERRRNVLRYLQDADGAVEMRNVAEQVAAWENDTTVEALASDERQRVYIPLYQSHLPKLDDAGVIEYDRRRGIVERDELADELAEYLAPSFETDDDDGASARGRYFLGASGAGAALLAGTASGVPPFGILSETAASVAVLAGFWALSLGARLGIW